MGSIKTGTRTRNRYVMAATVGLAGAVAVAVLAVLPAQTAVRTPQHATLSLSGAHPAGRGFHEGTFTAAPPLCPSGTWLADSEEEGDGLRDFTCANGSGTFNTEITGDIEHQAGMEGPWTITGGTGSWVKLRGKGTATTDVSTGPGSSPIVFSSTWTGTVDFDSIAPSLRTTSITVIKAKKPRKTGNVTVSFTSQDNVPTNAVTFRISVTSGQYFAVKTGPVVDGKGSAAFVFRRSEVADTMEIGMHVFDPWENERSLHPVVKVR